MQNRPNILLILSDQHRFCDMGCMGNREVSTPCLDKMASEGAIFDHAYSNCPVCVPARGCLITGLHAFRHKAAANDMQIDHTLNSIAAYLKREGYSTAYIGKWNLGGIPRDRFIPEEERMGFEFWRACNCNHDYMHGYYFDNENIRHEIEGYEPIGQTDLALEYLDRQKDSRNPFMMILSYGPPHDPYLCLPEGEPEACMKCAQDITLRKNISRVTETDYIPPEGHHAYGDGRSVPKKEFTESSLKTDYAGYYKHIEHLDAQIGRILSVLRRQGKEEDTLVIYTSDHGNMLGSHGCINKQWYYEESVHVPLLMRWPGHIQPGRRKQAIGTVDLLPSLLGTVNIPTNANDFDGIDMHEAVLRADAPDNNIVYLYSVVPAHQAWRREIFSWRAITDGHILYAADQNGKTLALYYLDTDPYETQNLAETEEIAVRQLHDILRKYTDKYDGFKPWQVLLRENGLKDEWNRSQKHFNYPVLE